MPEMVLALLISLLLMPVSGLIGIRIGVAVFERQERRRRAREARDKP